MDRRKFITQTALGTFGVLLSTNLISCAKENISLESLLGNSSDLLLKYQFNKVGNDYFSYSILEKDDFQHKTFKGTRAFVFSEEKKITGFTIQTKGINEVSKFIDQLTLLYKEKEKVFENEFGTEYVWKVKNKHIKLCFSKEYEGLEQNTYYSEYLPESKLVVF